MWPIDKDVPSAEKEECNHLNCRVSALYAEYLNQTKDIVSSWAVKPAIDTDRVAVTIFQPASDIDLFAYVIRANMFRLGQKWALQIFYGKEAERKALDQLLGSPENVTWTPIMLNGTRRDAISKQEANWFRLSMDFWGAIPEAYENALIFESDSLVLKGHGCIDNFLGYDYVGAPWNTSEAWGRRLAPSEGGNGGLSLRKRSSSIAAVTHKLNWGNRYFPDPSTFDHNEDGEMVFLLKALHGLNNGSGAKFPDRDLAMTFSVENLFYPRPCGFHNPWEFLNAGQVKHLLKTAEMS